MYAHGTLLCHRVLLFAFHLCSIFRCLIYLCKHIFLNTFFEDPGCTKGNSWPYTTFWKRIFPYLLYDIDLFTILCFWGAPKWVSGRKSLLHNPCFPFRTTLPHALTPPERCASPSEYDTLFFRLWFSHHGRVTPVSVRKPLQSPNSSRVASPAFLTNQHPARGGNRTGSLRFRPPRRRAPNH